MNQRLRACVTGGLARYLRHASLVTAATAFFLLLPSHAQSPNDRHIAAGAEIQRGRETVTILDARLSELRSVRDAAAGAANERKVLDVLVTFTDTHRRITGRIIEAARRGEFDDPATVIDFNQAFVELFPHDLTDGALSPSWQQVMADCRAADPEQCALASTTAHIARDMPQVFAQLGCLTRHDWTHIFEVAVEPSVAEAAAEFERFPRGSLLMTAGFRGWIVGEYVRYLRDAARAKAGCP